MITGDHTLSRALDAGPVESGAIVIGAPGVSVAGIERSLLDALARSNRSHDGRVAMAVRLSAMASPGPRPHHRRIIRAVMEDTSRRYDGQTFALANGDLVLLCRAGGSGAAGAPEALPDMLSRLLRADMPDASGLISVWNLAETPERAFAYATARAAEAGTMAAPEDQSGSTDAVDTMDTLASTAIIPDLMHRQTGIALITVPHAATAAAGAARGQALRPIYHEISFSIAALEARIRADSESTVGRGTVDPFLFRHLAGRLDRRMLALLIDEFGSGSTLDLQVSGSADHPVPPIHLNLAPGGVLSPPFGRLAEICRSAGVSVGIGMPMVEACADAAEFNAACRAIRAAGFTFVLAGVTHVTMLVSRPAALAPDLLKLDWSPRMAELGAEDGAELRSTIADVGPQRIVLQRADSEAALHWGLSHGVRRFQGRHVDAMLGASRLVGCEKAAACTLRQCTERAGAAVAAGRAGCRNLALLDGGAPPPKQARSGRAITPAPRQPFAVAPPREPFAAAASR